MPTPTDRRLDEFVKRIGFNQIGSPAHQVVVLAWPDPRTFAALSGNHWEVERESLYSGSTFSDAEKSWSLRVGEDPLKCRRLEIQVLTYFSSQRARDGFLFLCGNTTMMEIPYVRSNFKWGELAVEGKNTKSPSAIWIRKNVVAAIWDESTDETAPPAPVVDLASEIDALMARHEVDAAAAPYPKVQITASTDRAKVGEAVIIRIVAALPSPSNPDWAIDARERGTGFASAEADVKDYKRLGPLVVAAREDSRTFSVKALGAGDTAVDVVVTDPSTLLGCAKRFPITIRSK